MIKNATLAHDSLTPRAWAPFINGVYITARFCCCGKLYNVVTWCLWTKSMFFTKIFDPAQFFPFPGSPTKGGSGFVQGVSKIGLQKSKITILTWKSMSDPPNILYNCSKPPGDLPRTCSIELWRFVGSKIGFSHILPSKWSKMAKNAQNRSFLTILKAKYG